MKIIKVILIICVLTLSSCKDKTCTEVYLANFKMDSNQLIDVSVNYIGPDKHKASFNFGNTKNIKSYYKILDTDTYCSSTDFKKVNHNFLTLTNNGTGEVYFCAFLVGAEMAKPNNVKENLPVLFRVYHELVKDPNYDYVKKHKDLKYIDKYKLYEKLIKEGYPNIIKLKPKEKYLMKWGNLGFQRIK